MRTLTRKEFLQTCAVAIGAATIAPSSPREQTATFTTIATDPFRPRLGKPPLLFAAVGLSATTRKLREEGIGQLQVMASPRGGPYLHAWMFGGTVKNATYRNATIELELDQVGAGYHFIELFVGGLYPYAFYDATPVQVDGRLMNGTLVRRFVPRMQTLALPRLVIEVFATLAGRRVSAFALTLPEFHPRQIPA